MPNRYLVPVTETRYYSRTYVVEADSAGQAHELAEKGETVHESEGILIEIADREVTAIPKLEK